MLRFCNNPKLRTPIKLILNNDLQFNVEDLRVTKETLTFWVGDLTPDMTEKFIKLLAAAGGVPNKIRINLANKAFILVPDFFAFIYSGKETEILIN